MSGEKEMSLEEVREKIKELLVANLSFLDELDPKQIKNDEILFREGLGLDSLDAVEIVVIIQRHFGVQIRDMEQGREIFQTIDTLARFIHESLAKEA